MFNNNYNNQWNSQPPQYQQQQQQGPFFNGEYSMNQNQWAPQQQPPPRQQQQPFFNGEYPMNQNQRAPQPPQQQPFFNGEYPMNIEQDNRPLQPLHFEPMPPGSLELDVFPIEPQNRLSFNQPPPDAFMSAVNRGPISSQPPPPPMKMGGPPQLNAFNNVGPGPWNNDNANNGNYEQEPAYIEPPKVKKKVACPVCDKMFPEDIIDDHVNSHFEEKTEDNPKCGICGRENCKDIFLPDECVHFFCKSCLHDHIISQMAREICDIKCPDKTCKSSICSRTLREILTPEEFKQLEDISLRQVAKLGNLITCPNPSCGIMMEFVDAIPSPSEIKAAEAETDEFGKKLTPEAAEHHCRYRIRCRNCGTDFCVKCMRSPYHIGFTCESFEAYGKTEHCRYCHEKALPGKFFCDDEECMEKSKIACGKPLPCGHHCYGIAGEKTHLVCLHEDCKDSAGDIDGNEFCLICYSEGLAEAPAIQLKCGHVFHYKCVLSQLEKRWTGSRITFGFMLCPKCKREISHPALEKELKLIRPIKTAVETKALKRLKDLGLDKSDDVTKKGEEYYGRPLDYAMHKFCYYMCHKCKEPYYGGDRACENNEDGDYDPTELLCVKCNPFHAESTCKIHGSDYIEWKCKFCCNVAAFFCWGTTHFCEQCHKEAARIARLPRDKLPKCTCGIPHPPNGEEFLLGCSLCRLKSACYK